MKYMLILILGLFFLVIPTLYVKMNFSLKRQIHIDLCILISMMIVTAVFKMPNNLLISGLVFFLWILIGNIFKFIYPRLSNWIENQCLKMIGFPPNKETDEVDSGYLYVCKLAYFSVESGLLLFFIMGVFRNLFK